MPKQINQVTTKYTKRALNKPKGHKIAKGHEIYISIPRPCLWYVSFRYSFHICTWTPHFCHGWIKSNDPVVMPNPWVVWSGNTWSRFQIRRKICVIHYCTMWRKICVIHYCTNCLSWMKRSTRWSVLPLGGGNTPFWWAFLRLRTGWPEEFVTKSPKM
jgi:hypothetical protein